MTSHLAPPALDTSSAARAPRPSRRVPAAKLLLAALNLMALALTAWSLDERWWPARPAPVAPLAAPAAREALVTGGAWAASEAVPRLEDQLATAEREIRDLVEAILALRQDAALLAEDGQLAHERLQALETRLGLAIKGEGVRRRPGSAP